MANFAGGVEDTAGFLPRGDVQTVRSLSRDSDDGGDDRFGSDAEFDDRTLGHTSLPFRSWRWFVRLLSLPFSDTHVNLSFLLHKQSSVIRSR